jgi:hypothetical protein
MHSIKIKIMSNRKKGLKDFSTNPATKFIEWKSNDKCFSYYDKEKAENVQIKLPFKFLFLEDLHTVKGWDDANQCGIFSNEVLLISSQEMNVRSFKGGEIAKGLYKDIKEKIKASGAHYVKSIYIMLEDGELANIQLKGSAVQAFGEYQNKNKSRIKDEWILVKTHKDGKKGAVKFTTPEFSFERLLSDSEVEQADGVFDTLAEHLKGYLKTKPIEQEDNSFEADNYLASETDIF